MRTCLLMLLAILLLPHRSARSEEARLGLHRMPASIADALSAFRETSHLFADEMALNFEGDILGRAGSRQVPFNFDPSQHLLYRLVDFNSDGQPEAVLVFFWAQFGSRDGLPAVIMQRVRNEWIFTCEFVYEGNRTFVLNIRDEGWRRFRSGPYFMAWRRPAGGPAAARECYPKPPRTRRGTGR